MSARRTSWRTRVARAVLLVVAGAVSLSGCDFSIYSLPLPGGADVGSHPYHVQVKFQDVLDLVPQSAVKVDDVSVGRVDDITVHNYVADVTLTLNGDTKLPDNALATIRQTSLLGEKFVSLEAPPGGGSGRLSNGDVIPLTRSGRNPEVEEVLGALSLLLNGGGVAQLKTISVELSKALNGREGSVRDVLKQLDTFMGQLDQNKNQIVNAIASLNKLAIALNKQTPTIKLALDKLPRAIASINSQRADLVKMLKALARLSSVGVRVIKGSKAATIDSLRALAPTLTKLADAGSALPKSLQLFLTYPFVDSLVGKTAAQARSIHMGDYTNLSVQLDLKLDAGTLGIPTEVCKTLDQVTGSLPVTIPGGLAGQVGQLCGKALGAATDCINQLANGTVNPVGCATNLVDAVCKNIPDQLPTNVLQQVCGAVSGLPTALPSPSVGTTTLPVEPPTLKPVNPTKTVTDLQKCLQSSNPRNKNKISAACNNLDPTTYSQTCRQRGPNQSKPKGYNSDACKRYRSLGLIVKNGRLVLPALPGGSGGGGGLGGLTGNGGNGGSGSGGVTGIPGLNRPGFDVAPAAPSGLAVGKVDTHLGALLVWGMMQR